MASQSHMTMGLSSIGTSRVAAVLALLLVLVTGKNKGTPVSEHHEAMVVWTDREKIPQSSLAYSLWDGDGFSASHEMEDRTDYLQWIRGAYSPVRDEAIVVGSTFDAVAEAQVYSGGQWSDLLHSPLYDDKVSNFLHLGWQVVVEYESQSGNPLMAWYVKDLTTTIRYAKWTGARWSVGDITMPVHSKSTTMLSLSANPTSNEILLAVSASTDGRVYAIVWNGNSWGGVVASEYQYQYPLYPTVAYEQQSGRAMIMYRTGSSSPLYRIWNGVTWSEERSLSPPAGVLNRGRLVKINADPSTNRIVAVLTSHSDYAIWVAVWDGKNSWGSKAIAAPGPPSGTHYSAYVAFEATSQRAIVVYAQDNNQVKYRTWTSSSGWSGEEECPELGFTPRLLMLYHDNESDNIMLAVTEPFGNLVFCKWSGTEWGEVKRLPSNTQKVRYRSQPYCFMWMTGADTTVPTTFPSRLPTPPPTPLPTSTPSIKPTQQPTEVPTPQPTTKQPTIMPTPQPTSTPTAFPTRNPTPPPSLFPTPAPSIKPTTQPTRTRTSQPSPSPTIPPTSLPTPGTTQPPTPSPSRKTTKVPTVVPTITTSALTGPPSSMNERETHAGHPCAHNLECESSTCRNGVCMATSACYPLKHKFGEPFFEHKVNIVFVASGFDTATKEEWQIHVNRTYQSFENYNMFSNEIEQLNIFRVDPVRLDPSYCGLGCLGITRLLCCNKNRALSLAQKCFPVGSNLQTVVIHNDERYGGGGYVKDNIATASTHPLAPVVAAHELGHSLFDLTDEYSYGPGTDADPNCASTSSCDKWSDLIGNTPAGYDRVRCLPGCRNDNFYVGAKSFMNNLTYPMGAVNERFTCCTYCALTKAFPSYCNVFDPSPNYLLNYCRNNDYQRYGIASYDKEPLQSISAFSAQDSTSKYVQVASPVSVLITAKKKLSGDIVYKTKQSPLASGMFLRSHVDGDFSSLRMAWKQGFDSVLKVMIFYRRTGKEKLFLSRNTTIEVPLSVDRTDDDEAQHSVSEQAETLRCVVNTNGKRIKKIRVKVIENQKAIQ